MSYGRRLLPVVIGASCAAALGFQPDITRWPGEAELISSPSLWTTFAGNPTRTSVVKHGDGPSSINGPRWIKRGDGEASYEFYSQSGVVVSEDLVIVVGYEVGDVENGDLPRASVDSVVAFSRNDGSIAWVTEIPIAVLDSWSTPTVDTASNTVLVASSGWLTSISLDDGTKEWVRALGHVVVNASPVVTADLGPRNRAFITDHSFALGGSGLLHCVNTSPHSSVNPFMPGDLVWSVSLEGQTSGNTPAYRDGVVYVSTATGGDTWDQGTIRAFRADTDAPPTPIWVYHHTDPSGFFSGMAVKGDSIYASTYAFHGGQYSASTVRVDAATGYQRWAVPTNRTNTVPVPLGNGLIVVSTGLPYTSDLPAFGSLPSLQLIYEHPWGNGASRVWDTAAATLDDINSNGVWDPGEDFLAVGGWTNQPAMVLREGAAPVLYIGGTPDATKDGFFGPSREMLLVDLSKTPSDPGFVIDMAENTGGSPALVGREIYSLGVDGLHAYGAPSLPRAAVMPRWVLRTLPDFSGNGVLDWTDLTIALQYAHD